MAVDDFLAVPSPRETDVFVRPEKSLYPVDIPIAHYQLRHFISSPEPDLLYYASGADVYCLNTATKIQSHVTKLPWDARCTASGHGYVCVGGAEQGNFAAIKVEGFPPSDPQHVDSLLPLDLERHTSVTRPPVLCTPAEIQLEKIGEDIVNSISIHKFTAEDDGVDEVVAVLTNNDKTVRMYSLTLSLEITVLDLPFPMNHATISPDGKLLVAVGDQNVAYFFERVKISQPSSSKTSEGRPQMMAPPDWVPSHEVHLYVPPNSTIEGYFTTAWSPSCRFCAVGSECGYITIFDTNLLVQCENGEDAIVQIISSTRPENTIGPGAVRTMLFSPAPWDLLIWSEDQARVCVADLRSGLRTRQVLHLDPKAEDLEKVEIADFDINLSPESALRRETDFVRRYRRTLGSEDAAAVDFATDFLEASNERRRQHRRLGIVESDDDPHGLTAHERQILEALRSTRQREENREQGITPRSIHYHTAAGSPERRGLESARAEVSDHDHSLAELLSESARHAYLRRSSIALGNDRNGSGSGSNGTSGANSSENITDSPTTRSPGLIPSYRRYNAPPFSSTDEAWATIEDALGRNVQARTEEAGASNRAATTRNTDRNFRAMRERLRNLHGSIAPEIYSIGTLGGAYRRVSRSAHHDPLNGVRTAGLAMSQDGRTLFCGTEEGIFEFKINLQERKCCPSISPC